MKKKKLINVMCDLMIGRKIQLVKYEYKSLVTQETMIHYINGKTEEGGVKVDAEILSVELLDEYPLDRIQVKIKDGDIERYILLNITKKITLL